MSFVWIFDFLVLFTCKTVLFLLCKTIELEGTVGLAASTKVKDLERFFLHCKDAKESSDISGLG